MHFFEIENTVFRVFGYSVSYVELIGTLFGLASVYYATKANIMTWATGIVNEIFLFILFFQVQLYADMFLQVYFFTVTLYGWYMWNAKSAEIKISEMQFKTNLLLLLAIIIGTIFSGLLFKNIHLILPQYFIRQAAYPFTDSFVMVLSIIATFLLAFKKIENWHLWISVDVICVVLYFRKGIYFLSFEYLIFLGLASYGLYNWKRQLRYE
jgi:nicotinamide mononucleotide transporter